MKEDDNKKMILELAYASSLGIAMVVAVFGSLLIGTYVDKLLGLKSHIFAILFLVIGIVAGFRNYYLFFKRHFKDDKKKYAKRRVIKKTNLDGKVGNSEKN